MVCGLGYEPDFGLRGLDIRGHYVLILDTTIGDGDFTAVAYCRRGGGFREDRVRSKVPQAIGGLVELNG